MSTELPKAEPDWEPRSRSVTDRMAEVHADLRARCPFPFAAASPGLREFWSALRYEDIQHIARDTTTFANAFRPRLPIRRVPLESDPPEHTQIRKTFAMHFTPRRLAEMEVHSRRFAIELLTPLLKAGGGDFAHEFARPLPPQVLLTLIGCSREDWVEIKDACDDSLRYLTPDPDGPALSKAADETLWAYSRRVLDERKRVQRDPATDALTALMHARIDGQPIDEELVLGFVRLLVAAGHESTTSALSICLHHLARNTDDQARLRVNPALIPAAIEEMLRYESPVLMMPRTVTRDTELGGRSLKAGDMLFLNWASANRDGQAFEHPDQCQIERSPNRHLAFGFGIHTCLGAALARLELRVALEELLGRTEAFTLAGPVVHEDWHTYGVRSLPLSVRARDEEN
jgi:cytochrome P450